jgi:hypothetical protein
LIANLIRSIATRAWYANSNSIAVGQLFALALALGGGRNDDQAKWALSRAALPI